MPREEARLSEANEREGTRWRERLNCKQVIDIKEGIDLSRRAKDVLRLKIDGWTLREMATGLHLSRQRVERRIGFGQIGRLPSYPGAIEARLGQGVAYTTVGRKSSSA